MNSFCKFGIVWNGLTSTLQAEWKICFVYSSKHLSIFCVYTQAWKSQILPHTSAASVTEAANGQSSVTFSENEEYIIVKTKQNIFFTPHAAYMANQFKWTLQDELIFSQSVIRNSAWSARYMEFQNLQGLSYTTIFASVHWSLEIRP